MVELIPQNELDLMSDYISAYAFRNYNNANLSNRVSVKEVLKQHWECNKSTLFKMLGKKLYIEKHIEFDKSVSELVAEMNTIKYGDTFYSDFYNLISPCGSFYHNDQTVANLISDYALAVNVYHGPDKKLAVPNSLRPLKIQKGEKIIKILGKLAKAHNLRGFEEFRIKHSQILNQKRITGILRLSIHPMDYFTMSDSGCYNWESCMAWDGGEYRQGTVEMMNSPNAIVAYIRNENEKDDIHLKENHWPSKKWRSLFVVTEDIISNVCGYPYISESLDYAVLEWLRELAYENLGWEYHKEVFDYHAFQFSGSYYEPLAKNIRISTYTSYMYNDFGDSQRALIGINFDDDDVGITYSGLSQCVCCGGPAIPRADTLVCTDCEPITYCACCEDPVFDGDVVEVNGEKYCRWCYEEVFIEDYFTGDSIHVDYTVQIYLSPDDGATIYRDFYVKISSNFFDCQELDTFKEIFRNYCTGPIYEGEVEFSCWARREFFINISDLTEEGRNAFNLIGSDWNAHHHSYNEWDITKIEPVAYEDI